MRKSEAQLLKEQLEELYGEEWEMSVVNLRRLGFYVPETEHPFFIAGIRVNAEEEEEQQEKEKEAQQLFEQKSEVIIWDNRKNSWSVHRTTQWQIQRHEENEENVYIFDTRERTFVPIDQFQLPPTPQ